MGQIANTMAATLLRKVKGSVDACFTERKAKKKDKNARKERKKR